MNVKVFGRSYFPVKSADADLVFTKALPEGSLGYYKANKNNG